MKPYFGFGITSLIVSFEDFIIIYISNSNKGLTSF